jgi:uncharacterized phage protein gp47/JayE
MAEQHKPGEKVQTSRIYEAVKEGDGGSGFKVTCVEGEHPVPRTVNHITVGPAIMVLARRVVC